MSLVLIVDDEPDLLRLLEFNLRQAGLKTTSASTGEEALARARAEPPNLVVLDLMLPDISGTEVCRRLKQDADLRGVPVLMLTARAEEVDRIVGFELGADDYVVKPFNVRELVLRIQAILRRSDGTQKAPVDQVMRAGKIVLDLGAHRCRVEDREVLLTALEFKLLKTLIERAGRVQSREQLLSDVWDISAEIETRTVDTHVKRLREKLGVAGDCVETVRGVGYRLNRPENSE